MSTSAHRQHLLQSCHITMLCYRFQALITGTCLIWFSAGLCGPLVVLPSIRVGTCERFGNFLLFIPTAYVLVSRNYSSAILS